MKQPYDDKVCDRFSKHVKRQINTKDKKGREEEEIRGGMSEQRLWSGVRQYEKKWGPKEIEETEVGRNDGIFPNFRNEAGQSTRE